MDKNNLNQLAENVAKRILTETIHQIIDIYTAIAQGTPEIKAKGEYAQPIDSGAENRYHWKIHIKHTKTVTPQGESE